MISYCTRREKTFVVCGDGHFVASGDGDVLISYGVSGTNFRTFCVEGNSKRTTFLFLLSSTGIVNHTLMILKRYINCRIVWDKYLVTSMTEIHSDNIHACSTKFAEHIDIVGLGAC